MLMIFFHMSIRSMSHIVFKKCPCRPVAFNSQGPQEQVETTWAGDPNGNDRFFSARLAVPRSILI